MQEEQQAFLEKVLHAARSVIHLTSDSLKEISLAQGSAIDELKDVAQEQKQSLTKEGECLKRKLEQSFSKGTKRMKLSFKREKEKVMEDIKQQTVSPRKKVERISESEEYPKLKDCEYNFIFPIITDLYEDYNDLYEFICHIRVKSPIYI